nr:hypothetical protein [Rhodococcus oxybenzonivorans]
MGVFDRNLPVVFAVCDQERDGDVLHDTVEVDAVGEVEELVQVVVTPDPHHVFPVVRHRAFTFPVDAATLHLAPVVVCAPCHTQRGRVFRTRPPESLQAQCFAAAGAVDHQGGDTAAGEFVVEAGLVDVLYGTASVRRSHR